MLCQPPDPHPRPPKLKCPPGTVDCHVHVYGPNDQYPVSQERMFDVPEALPRTLAEVHDVLGVDRVVLVQPSGYGVDNRRQLEAMSELGRPARAVVSLYADVTEDELIRLHGLGVRGVRYAAGHHRGPPITEMPKLAARIAKFGWHVQLHVFSHEGESPLPELESVFAALPVDIVIDHIGSIDPASGIAQPGFTVLRRMVEAGKCWVKLSCGYRISAELPPYTDLIPYVSALTAVRPDRLVWASDWPHVFFKGKMPNTTDLLDQMLTWVPDEEVRRKIFVDNPAILYDFST
ncbi:amidohydrolase family protein [Acidocella facilis]|uniref:amidohydrolase family protein n=1 Tax=Acidocella facilis TaxID=525 RepID=UPI002286967F|nr:amidohydrolase family protein [Acidocella facilis]